MGLREKLGTWQKDLLQPGEKGRRFEVLVRHYLCEAPEYHGLFTNVWLWEAWPERERYFPHKGDIGIDLVAELAAVSGERRFCAIQCKFRHGGKISWEELGSFLGASERECFQERWLVATAPLTERAHRELASPGRQGPAFHLLTLETMEGSAVDWSRLKWEVPAQPELPRRGPRPSLPHQEEAIRDVCAGLDHGDRGQLIMACGSGKTHVALRVAERMATRSWAAQVPAGQEPSRSRPCRVLFLAPSIALVGQSLQAWAADATQFMASVVVCSDRTVGRMGSGKGKARDDEDITPQEIPYPVTTDPQQLWSQLATPPDGASLQVVFSTYQSLPVIVEMQDSHPEWLFDLVIADEAHRTTGYRAPGEEPSAFTLVHRPDRLRAKKRLYMTATPRMYAPRDRARAAETEIELYSMDDSERYGPVWHELTFAAAVEQGILSDYKILVLAVSNDYADQVMRRTGRDGQRELDINDTARLIGCWNGLAKRLHQNDVALLNGDGRPMRTALGFANSIRDSRQIARAFRSVSESLTTLMEDGSSFMVEAEHVDGTMDAVTRQGHLQWLASAPVNGTAEGAAACRLLMNARCLTEGVDVPELDAIVFFQPRNSFVDVVQAVGRVMRRSPTGNKRFGYVILPVVIHENDDPEAALANHDRYGVIWQVIHALRSHDRRLERELAQLKLQGQASESRIAVIGIGIGPDRTDGGAETAFQLELKFQARDVEKWQQALLARLVGQCAPRDYWKQWGRTVSEIAGNHLTILRNEHEHSRQQDPSDPDGFAARFEAFLSGLKATLRPEISEDEGLEMLAQHLVTQPIFDALFAGYRFTERNPVSRDLEWVLEPLNRQGVARERQKLEGFYRNVRERVEGITEPKARQKVLTELYQDFFQLAFPRLADQLGIVYTPVEIVDFMLHSTNRILEKHFGRSFGDATVDLLDPFAGTGTFIVRLLELGLIAPEKLPDWYGERLHANEIVLLAYYLAAINIEEAFHRVVGGEYIPFPGMVLADTFRLLESRTETFLEGWKGNNERVSRQKKRKIQVIIGNPPYAARQSDANENNPTQKYLQLDDRIRQTYARGAQSRLLNSLYDHYIRAFRWASDRIGEEGVIAFVTNGGWLESLTTAGFRRALQEEFSDVYVLNLRGDARSQGERRRKEGGNVFGSGSRATIAITLLVRRPDREPGQLGRIYYHDIGDYLTREEKLARLQELRDIGQVSWRCLQPDGHHDWLNQRRADFEGLVPMATSSGEKGIFVLSSNGVATARDRWNYHLDHKELDTQITGMVDFFHKEQKRVCPELSPGKDLNKRIREASEKVSYDKRSIKWGQDLFQFLVRGETIQVSAGHYRPALYRPFFPMTLAFHPRLNARLSRQPEIFPEPGLENLVILVEGPGGKGRFSCLLTDRIPDLHVLSSTQAFPRYRYVRHRGQARLSPAQAEPAGAHPQWTREDAISDEALQFFRSRHQCPELTRDDLFYYVYGVLHAPEYRTRYANNLMRELPRIPPGVSLDAFRETARIGRQLAELHLNYAGTGRLPGVTEENRAPEDMDAGDSYRVRKMTFGPATGPNQKGGDKGIIVFNPWITLRNIPTQAYDYVINGKSAIEWVMERYCPQTDEETGITWDPNVLSRQSGNPRYILDLLHGVITVSQKTCDLVAQLPSPF